MDSGCFQWALLAFFQNEFEMDVCHVLETDTQ